jgi:hypothetical protein
MFGVEIHIYTYTIGTVDIYKIKDEHVHGDSNNMITLNA